MALYAIEFERPADQALRGIGDIQQAIEVPSAIRTLEENPRLGLQNPNAETNYLLQAGRYWLVYFIDEGKQIVRIVSILRGSPT